MVHRLTGWVLDFLIADGEVVAAACFLAALLIAAWIIVEIASLGRRRGRHAKMQVRGSAAARRKSRREPAIGAPGGSSGGAAPS